MASLLPGLSCDAYPGAAILEDVSHQVGGACAWSGFPLTAPFLLLRLTVDSRLLLLPRHLVSGDAIIWKVGLRFSPQGLRFITGCLIPGSLKRG
ncbi:hypothetical protein FKM82_009844 [Ascaphus truei]